MHFKRSLVDDYRAQGDNAFYIVRKRRDKGYSGYWEVLVFVEDQLAAEITTIGGALIPTREAGEKVAKNYDAKGSGIK